MRERYSFVVLVVLCLATSALSVGIALRQIDVSNHKFCQVMTSITAHPVPKPPDPKKDPSREGRYQVYKEFVDLSRSLGC